jgi:hypothetical protein
MLYYFINYLSPPIVYLKNTSEIMNKVMNKEFAVHHMTPTGLVGMEKIAELFDNLLNNLEDILTKMDAPEIPLSECTKLPKFSSREFSIVRTKLEEACFFAKKAYATAQSKNNM